MEPRRVLDDDDERVILDVAAPAARGSWLRGSARERRRRGAREAAAPVDLVISDKDMPGMSGVQGVNARRGLSLQLRIGVHTGPVVAGVIGLKKFSCDLWGDTVNIASGMESSGLPGRVHVTPAVRDALLDTYASDRRGIIDVKGKGQMETWFLLGRR